MAPPKPDPQHEPPLGGDVRLSRRQYGQLIADRDLLRLQLAGGTADAFTLFELFESKMEQYGKLTRAAIELAKEWRTDRRLRRLEALLCVADAESSFIVSGNGDVIEPENDLMAIGSGGPYAQAAALALMQNTELGAKEIVEKSLQIAGDICVYTNQNIVVEELQADNA